MLQIAVRPEAFAPPGALPQISRLLLEARCLANSVVCPSTAQMSTRLSQGHPDDGIKAGSEAAPTASVAAISRTRGQAACQDQGRRPVLTMKRTTHRIVDSLPGIPTPFAAPSFNGRTADSGSAYRGSNPWGAANKSPVFFDSLLPSHVRVTSLIRTVVAVSVSVRAMGVAMQSRWACKSRLPWRITAAWIVSIPPPNRLVAAGRNLERTVHRHSGYIPS